MMPQKIQLVEMQLPSDNRLDLLLSSTDITEATVAISSLQVQMKMLHRTIKPDLVWGLGSLVIAC